MISIPIFQQSFVKKSAIIYVFIDLPHEHTCKKLPLKKYLAIISFLKIDPLFQNKSRSLRGGIDFFITILQKLPNTDLAGHLEVDAGKLCGTAAVVFHKGS